MTEQRTEETGNAYPITLESSLFNERGALTISAYQRILSGISERDLMRTNIDVPSLIARFGVSWVMLSMSIEIHRPIRRDAQLYARTWHTGKAGFIYRREIGICDMEGNRAVSAATFFSLLDIQSRKLCMDPKVHKELTLPGGAELLEASSRLAKQELAFDPVEERSVRPSWIDYLGHVNNARYGELAYDALSDAQREAFSRLSRLELYFTRELRPGSGALMERAEQDDALFVRASILPEQTPSFVVKLQFENA